MRAQYGQSLRRLLAAQNPLCLLDLGPGIFTATVDTNILLLQKAANQNALQALTLNAKAQFDHLDERQLNPLPAPSEQAWIILSPAEQALKEKIEKVGTPLKDWDVQINYGIKTGYNKAFIIDTARRDELVAQDPKSADIIKPILRGRDIKRYRHAWAGLWVINPHNGYADELRAKIPAINIETYPAIKAHLDQHWDKLERRQDQGKTPYNLRNCAYIQAFEREKVVWTPVNSEYRFTLISEEVYFNNSVFMITGECCKYLLAIFNSRLLRKYLTFAFSSEKNYTYASKNTMIKIAIPEITPANRTKASEIETLVDTILHKKTQGESTTTEEQEIDRLVYALYSLTEAEIVVVEKK